MAVNIHRRFDVLIELPLTSLGKLAVIAEEGEKERKGCEVDENQ